MPLRPAGGGSFGTVSVNSRPEGIDGQPSFTRQHRGLAFQNIAPTPLSSFVDDTPDFDEVEIPQRYGSPPGGSATQHTVGMRPRGGAVTTSFHVNADIDDRDSLPVVSKRRGMSVSPADVFGVAPDTHSANQARERERMTGPVTSLNERDFVVFGGDDDPNDSGRRGGYVRGTTCKLLLRPGEDVAALENQISKTTLAPPAELGRSVSRHHTMPNASLIPAPRTDRPKDGDPIPPLLRPAFLEVDVIDDEDDPFNVVQQWSGAKGDEGVAAANTFDPHAVRNPKYVPFAVRPLGHDEVHWRPLKHESTVAAEERRRALLSITEASAAERPPPPPAASRDIAAQYRARQQLVAYDESEAFGFRARPLHDNGALAQLREEMRAQQTSGAITPDAIIRTIRHHTSCYIVSADRRRMLRFDPTDTGRHVGGAGMWESLDIQDGSLFIGVSAYPPTDAVITPVPNVPYMVAATTTMLHVLSLEDCVWFLCCVRGIEECRLVGWAHLVNEQTLYIRSKSRQHHGLVPLKAVLEELTVLRRCPHDVDTDQPSYFVENRLKYVECRMLRRKPCPDSLVAVDAVPGIALHPKPKENHMWIFVFNAVAATFLPWRRIENGTLFFVAMDDHLVRDATTVLFFAEQLHRVDIGSVVDQNTAKKPAGGGGSSARSSMQTQRILRVAQRLVVHHLPDCSDAIGDAGGRNPRAARQRGTYDSSSSAPTRLFATGRSVILRWKTRGAVLRSSCLPASHKAEGQPENEGDPTTARDVPNEPAQSQELEERLELVDLVNGDETRRNRSTQVVDLVIKARRSEVHTIIPMHERCAAVLSFDCATYVVVELDRVSWIHAIGADGPGDPLPADS